MSEPQKPDKRWPVSDREVKPLWAQLLDWSCVGLLVLVVLALIAAAVSGWVHVLGL